MNERKQQIRQDLEAARARTLRLMGFVSDDFLKVRVHDFYSPVGWHFGHIGMTEEYWTVYRAMRHVCADERLSFLFANVPENPKNDRVHLPERGEIRAYLASTRESALSELEDADLDSSDPLLRDGYAWEFAYQHECQHQESIVELLHLIQRECANSKEMIGFPWRSGVSSEMVPIPAGRFMMGSNDLHGYDNERAAHCVALQPFEMDQTPVTAHAWTEFMSDGGYRRKELWSEAGWAWRIRENAMRPEYWVPTDSPKLGGWGAYYGPLGVRAIHPDEPVSSISWFEADAYARWAGKRLPTEAEWEYAASFDPDTEASRRYPWGIDAPDSHHGSFGLQDWAPQPVGKSPQGASGLGLLDMSGGVWEWTSTPFLPYDGFEAYPYDGYSKEHMDGNHYVCRGGSWATSGRILRCSFRNWYVPTYRQGFLGLRCAR